MNKRTLSDIYRIGIQRLIKKGLRITIIPSYTCNYKCDYCSRNMDGGKPTTDKANSLDEWKRYLTDLDKTFRLDGSKIKEIVLTGGEPTLLPYFVELCNWITERWLLTVYTNLSRTRMLYLIRQTPRLMIHATYHAGQVNNNEFNYYWRATDEIHRVEVDEIGERRLRNPHKRTRLKPFAKIEEVKSRLAMLRVDPNFAAYLYCTDDAKANTLVAKLNNLNKLS